MEVNNSVSVCLSPSLFVYNMINVVVAVTVIVDEE